MSLRVLVTGGTGYIGKNLVAALVSKGYQLAMVSRPSAVIGPDVARNPNITVIRAEGERELAKQILHYQPQLVLHLATLYITEHRGDQISDLISSNIIFPVLIADIASRLGDCVFINTNSSWQFDDAVPVRPVNLYACSKQGFKSFVEYYSDQCGLKCIDVTIFDTYGPNDRRPKLLNKIFEMIKKNSKEPLDLTSGTQKLDIVYIDDIIGAYINVVENYENAAYWGKNFGLSSNVHVSVRHLIEKTVAICDAKIQLNWGAIPDRTNRILTPWTNYDRLPGWHAATSYEQGVVKCLRENR